jgi:predicted phage tail protein
MCEQIQALSAKIEGLETAFAATRNTQHQSPASDIQKQQHHASEPEPAPNLTQLTEVLSTLVTKFEVLQHDMTTLKGQLQEGASKSKSSPSRKKSKNIDNQKPAVTPQDEGPYPSLHNAVHLPSIRPDGTPDEGEMQDEDVDHDSL